MNEGLEEALGLVKRTCELFIKSASHLIGSDIIANQINEALDTIKQALIKAQKQEKKIKALEIIKKKLVNVVDLYQCTDLYTYNSLVKGTFFDGVPRELIQEEFDLLKEELRCWDISVI